jgi:hypothetical protein
MDSPTQQKLNPTRRYLPIVNSGGTFVERPDLMIFAALGATRLAEINDKYRHMLLVEKFHPHEEELGSLGSILQKEIIEKDLASREIVGSVVLSLVQIAALTGSAPSLNQARLLTAYRLHKDKGYLVEASSILREVRKKFSKYRDISHMLAAYVFLRDAGFKGFENKPDLAVGFLSFSRGFEIFIDNNVVSDNFHWNPIRIPESIRTASKFTLLKLSPVEYKEALKFDQA